MAEGDLAAIRSLVDRLCILAGTFPDFRYAELEGAPTSDVELTTVVLSAFIAGAECEYSLQPDESIVRCVYGSDLEGATSQLKAIADDAWLTVRNVSSHFE